MSGRGGLPVKNIIYAVAAMFLVYLLYIYHGSQNRLHEAEMTGARYKREVEERVTEIQDLVKGHDKFQETCQKEKRELQNTINSVNTKYKMLESHQRDTDADLQTMKQHLDQMKQEHSDAYTQHAQEFQALKQEKDNEIARIKDELADATRNNRELENNIISMKQQLVDQEVLQQKVSECTASLRTADEKLASCETSLKSGKSHRDKPAAVDVPEDKHEVPESKKVQKEAHKSGPAAASNANETSGSEVHINGTEDLIEQDKNQRNQLAQENARLQQSLSERQQQQQQQPARVVQLQQQQQQQEQQQKLQLGNLNGGQDRAQSWLPNNRKAGANVYDMKIDSPLKDLNRVGGDNNDFYGKGLARNGGRQDSDLGQVMPPKLPPEGDSADQKVKEGFGADAPKVGVNPNDEQKVQIMEPFLPNKEKEDEAMNEEDDREDGVIGGDKDGGGEEGEDKRHARDEEAEREAGARREEEEGEGGEKFADHQNPLALRQLEVPGNLESHRQEVIEDEAEMMDRGGRGAGGGDQLLVPNMGNREGDQQDKLGDNQYFGEADEDRQMNAEDNGNDNNEEEDEGEEDEEEEEDEQQEMENEEEQADEGEHHNIRRAINPVAPA